MEREGVSRWDVEDSLTELRQLAATAGAQVVDTVVQKLEKPTAPFYIGKGKAEEVARQCGEKHVTSLIFDDELSPAQGRNLEQLTSRKVLDRTQLILDIFARRARTREGRLQIELAQLQYLLPRLTRMWTHLSRQTGGIGTRGPGETQLEVDRRRVQERIARLERDLRGVRKNRTVQREGRLRRNWPVASLVGYTNAGKSSLLNSLTGAGVLAEDKLFATLDPTTRQLVLPNRQKVLLTDTVGFIRKLPHTVIESFKATLEEVQLADLLIHVVDLSHPQYREQMAAVDETVAELGADGKQTVIVFNKIDRLADREITQQPAPAPSWQRRDFGAHRRGHGFLLSGDWKSALAPGGCGSSFEFQTPNPRFLRRFTASAMSSTLATKAIPRSSSPMSRQSLSPGSFPMRRIQILVPKTQLPWPPVRRHFLVLLSLSLGACATKIVEPRKKTAIYDIRPVHVQTGIASWYRDHRTASGERFNVNALAAAHKSLPFGSKVRVIDLKTGKSIIVRINDRGPYIRGRIIRPHRWRGQRARHVPSRDRARSHRGAQRNPHPRKTQYPQQVHRENSARRLRLAFLSANR